MRGCLALVAMLAACYSPSAQPGAPCGPGSACPAGQACVAGICGGTEPDDDAAVPPDDAAPDTNQITVDAAPDTPPYIPWANLVELTSLETTSSNESDPSITTDKLTVVLSADDTNGLGELYIATRSALTDTFTPTLLTVLNDTNFDESSPEISGDGMTIFFTSERSGAGDVYVSTFTTVWSTPVLRTDLSTADEESELAISPDGLTAAVVRDISGQPEQIYIFTRATTADLFENGTVHPELNVTTDIAAPTITNNADVIYLHAGQPRNIYRATRNPNGSFTTPVPVNELNTADREAAPFVLQGDDYMIFDGGGDIIETTR